MHKVKLFLVPKLQLGNAYLQALLDVLREGNDSVRSFHDVFLSEFIKYGVRSCLLLSL